MFPGLLVACAAFGRRVVVLVGGGGGGVGGGGERGSGSEDRAFAVGIVASVSERRDRGRVFEDDDFFFWRWWGAGGCLEGDSALRLVLGGAASRVGVCERKGEEGRIGCLWGLLLLVRRWGMGHLLHFPGLPFRFSGGFELFPARRVPLLLALDAQSAQVAGSRYARGGLRVDGGLFGVPVAAWVVVAAAVVGVGVGGQRG